jgi:uncharacterized alpha-E superfamily protein
MLSRVAENLYWMARYLERAENTARMINSTTQVLLDLPRGATLGWGMLIQIAGLDDAYRKLGGEADETSIMRFLILDERNSSSIFSCIRFARENTRTFREVLPMELWERINDLYLFIQRNAARTTQDRNQRYEVLMEVIGRRQGIVGLLSGALSYDATYQFIKFGRNIERADMTTRILDVNSAVQLPDGESALEEGGERLWMATLRALSAYEMYRRHCSVHVRGLGVVRYLLDDPLFPRTVRHCLIAMESCLEALPEHVAPMHEVRVAFRQLDRLLESELTTESLHTGLDDIQADLAKIHEVLSRQYFYLHHAPVEASQLQVG